MITKHDTVYIAGSMTGKPNYNFQAFNDAESYLNNTYACKVDYAIRNSMQIIKQDYDFNKCSQ